jgi:hypothetical protein
MANPNDPKDPAYYSKYECQHWDVSYALFGPAGLLAHALKYVMRAGKKPSSSMLRDVRAALNYLHHLEEKLASEYEDGGREDG